MSSNIDILNQTFKDIADIFKQASPPPQGDKNETIHRDARVRAC